MRTMRRRGGRSGSLTPNWEVRRSRAGIPARVRGRREDGRCVLFRGPRAVRPRAVRGVAGDSEAQRPEELDDPVGNGTRGGGAGQTASAERDLRAAAGLCANARPASRESRWDFSWCGRGARREAVAPLEETLRKYPESADAHTYLGRALLESGDVAGAIPHLERAVALAPASAQAHLLLAKAYTRSGRAEDARKHSEAAAKYGQEK